MLDPSLDRDRGILVLELTGPQERLDADRVAALIEPYLAEAGRLRGVLIDTRRFPGWTGAEALFAEERFLRDFAPLIDRIAFVTDSDLVAALARFATGSLSPAIRRFPWAEYHAAMAWLSEG